MNIVNCTPHTIVLAVDGQTVNFPASGEVARVSTERVTLPSLVIPPEECATCSVVGGYCGNCCGAHWGPGLVVPVVRQTFGAVEGLPAPAAGVTLVVSAMVLSALQGTRPDVVAPDTGPTAIRENGQIKAVRGFVQ